MVRLHKILGYSGLVPFFGFALLYHINDVPWDFLLVVYSALIFSFLAGLLWASTLNYELPTHALYVSISAMLWSFMWIFFWVFFSGLQNQQFHSFLFIVISFSFIALYYYERMYLSKIYSASFLKLRAPLSLSVAGIFFLVAII